MDMLKEKIDNIIKKTKAERLNKKMIFDGGFIKVFKEDYKLPDGRVITKESISKNNNKDAAIILTRTLDNKYLVVFQNRVNNIVSAEFPSGYIEDDEEPIKGALREVKEETGFISDKAVILDKFIPNIGTESAFTYVILVLDAEKKEKQDLDDDEYINYELFTFDELKYLLDNGYIQSSGNKLAFYHLKEYLSNNK